MEPLVLHHLAIIAQQLHAQLEVFPALHISHHYVVIRTVQQDLSQQLDALSLGHIGVRLDQNVVESPKEQFEVGREVCSDEVFMAGQNFLRQTRQSQPFT